MSLFLQQRLLYKDSTIWNFAWWLYNLGEGLHHSEKNRWLITHLWSVYSNRLSPDRVSIQPLIFGAGKVQCRRHSWESARGGQLCSMPHEHAVKTWSVFKVRPSRPAGLWPSCLRGLAWGPDLDESLSFQNKHYSKEIYTWCYHKSHLYVQDRTNSKYMFGVNFFTCLGRVSRIPSNSCCVSFWSLLISAFSWSPNTCTRMVIHTVKTYRVTQCFLI